MSFWNVSPSSIFSGLAHDHLSPHHGFDDPYALTGRGHVRWTDFETEAPLQATPDAGLQGPIDGLFESLRGYSDHNVKQALLADDALMASGDPAAVTYGVLHKTFDMVEEGGRHALFGVVESVLHPIDTGNHVLGALAAPRESLSTWWHGTDDAHKFQDMLSLSLVGGGVRSAPTPWAPGVAASTDVGEQAASFGGAARATQQGESMMGHPWSDLSEHLGRGMHVPELNRLDRDYSRHMPVDANGNIDYWGPMALGVKDHLFHASLDKLSGELRFTVQRSANPQDAHVLGYGSEMFGSAMRAYREDGLEVKSIVGSWSVLDGLTSNYEQFLSGLDAGLSPERAALDTFTGRQAQSFGFTHVDVPADEGMWRRLGVQPRFTKPDWGGDASWNDYANAYVSSMGRR